MGSRPRVGGGRATPRSARRRERPSRLLRATGAGLRRVSPPAGSRAGGHAARPSPRASASAPRRASPARRAPCRLRPLLRAAPRSRGRRARRASSRLCLRTREPNQPCGPPQDGCTAADSSSRQHGDYRVRARAVQALRSPGPLVGRPPLPYRRESTFRWLPTGCSGDRSYLVSRRTLVQSRLFRRRRARSPHRSHRLHPHHRCRT